MPKLVADRYRVEEKIGEGGMGEVLAAYDETLQRRVVLKFIREDRQGGELALRRFRREAQILSQLDHDSICRIYDLVEEDGADYLVLEHIEGRTLHEVMGDELGRDEKLAIAAGILDALVVAHAAGIVHRDLKPGNVMITAAGDVKVLDFGLAHLTTGDESEELDVPEPGEGAPAAPFESEWGSESAERTLGMRTEYGTISGTLLYMSPEQAAGDDVGPAGDVYSLGLLFQDLFTGEPPHPQDLEQMELWERASLGRSLPIEGLDADLTNWLESMKAFSPTMRPTARAAAERLAWIRGKGRRRLVRAGVAAAVLAVIGGVTKYTLDLKHQRGVAESERNAAQHEREVAREERSAAILARQRAEKLIEFMIVDLHEKLEKEGGKLDLLDDSYAEALDYFVAVDEDDLTKNELMARCELLGRIAETRSAQGRFEEALAFSRESVAQAEALHRRDPDDPEAILNLSNSVFYLGLTYYLFQRYDEAVEQYELYRELSERLLAHDPEKRAWQIEVAYAWLNLGVVHADLRETETALVEMNKSLEVWDRMLEQAPADAELLAEKAEVQSWIAETLVDARRSDEAMPVLEEELATREKIYEANGRNVHDKLRLAVCHFNFGSALLTGDPDTCERHLGLACRLMTELHEHDRANTDWAHQLAHARLVLGTACANRGGTEEAQGHWEQSAQLLDELLETDGNNPTWLGTRMDVDSRLATLD